MNCISITCNSDCNQGRSCDCIDRAHQTNITARKAEWDQVESGHNMPQEAGNVWFAQPKPVRMTWYEAIVIYTGLIVIAAGATALIAGSLGWVFERFFN